MTIQLSQAAISAIRQALKKRGRGIGISLDISVNGQTGPGYRLEFSDRIGNRDICFDQDSVRIVTDMKNMICTEDLVPEYGQMGDDSGFSVRHAADCNACACGADSACS